MVLTNVMFMVKLTDKYIQEMLSQKDILKRAYGTYFPLMSSIYTDT